MVCCLPVLRGGCHNAVHLTCFGVHVYTTIVCVTYMGSALPCASTAVVVLPFNFVALALRVLSVYHARSLPCPPARMLHRAHCCCLQDVFDVMAATTDEEAQRIAANAQAFAQRYLCDSAHLL